MPNRLVTLLATTICVIGLAACGSSKKTGSTPAAPVKMLDTKSVAQQIEDTISSERGITAKVSCPASVVEKKGVKFVCNAVVKNQGTTPFDVTETDDNGATDFAARN